MNASSGPKLLTIGVVLAGVLVLGVAVPVQALHFGPGGAAAAPTIAEIDWTRRAGRLASASSMARQALRVAERALATKSTAPPAKVPGTEVDAASGVKPATMTARLQVDRLRFALAVLLVTRDQDPGRQVRGREAAKLLEAVAAEAFGLPDRRLVWLARAHLASGEDDKAKAVIAKFLAADDDSDEAEELRLALGAMAAKAQDYEALTAATDPLMGRGVGIHYRAAALVLRANALEDRKGSTPEETEAIQADFVSITKRLLVEFPGEPGSQNLDDEILKSLSKSERYKRALNLMEAWDYAEARTIFEALRKEGYRTGAARWKIAEISIFKLRDDMPKGREALSTWVRRSKARGREKALYWTMRAFVKDDHYDDARKLLKVLSEDYPGGEYQERVDFYKGWLPYDEGNCNKAMPLMVAYMKTHRAKADGMRAPYAWCRMRKGQWKAAMRALGRQLRKDHPLKRGRSLYWQAYVLDKQGLREEALVKLAQLQQRFPLTHYGMLGLQLKARFEGRDPAASKQPWPAGGGIARWTHEPAAVAWEWPSLSGRKAQRFQRVRNLVAVGELDIARAEYARIRGAVERTVSKEQRLPFIIFMGHQVQDHKTGWRLATGGSFSKKTGMPDAADPEWLLAYPQAYRPLIERLGRKYRVDPNFTYGIMRHESAFKPSAVSHADAVGALQMIKPTAKLCAKDLNRKLDWRDFAKPRVGFEYSLFYLGKHRRIWGGALIPTAASYNAGPEPVARWLKAHQGKPLAFVVEEYVYKEARNYARRVAEHALRYLYLYQPDERLRADTLDSLYPAGGQRPPPAEVGY